MITGRQLTSTANKNGTLRLAVEDFSLDGPGADEVVVRIEAAPINPTDIGLLLGPAEIASLEAGGTPDRPVLTFNIPEQRLSRIAGRVGQALAVGIEGAGIVVDAGANVKALEGRRVALFGQGMFADYCRVAASAVIPLPGHVAAADGAALFVNPMTALGFVETARREGHRAIVHTAAASNLGQMLQKICLRDAIPLVNIVRSEQQEELLRRIGATHVLNSRDEDFPARLLEAVAETGATIAFDAIGGGRLGSDILTAMEQAATRKMTTYSHYGSSSSKQLYVYGRLDPSLTVLDRASFGMQWKIGGWLLMPFLERSGDETVRRMRQRVIDELTTTFASRYTRTIGLAEALDPDVLRAYERKSTGQKYLIDPTRG
ncbi:MAG TPA: NADH oxidase [Rhizobiaceae bacterium]|nr:NADH oxidase [Rhizobiaceae bacterium]